MKGLFVFSFLIALAIYLLDQVYSIQTVLDNL